MSRRLPSAAVVLLVALLALSVGLSSASAERHATVTLTYMDATTFQIPDTLMIKNFNNVYPDIQIKVQWVPSGNIPALLATQFQAGNAPDLFWTKPGRARPTAVWPMAQAGRLLDLSDSPWAKRIYPPVKKYVMWNGKVYGAPYTVTPYVGIINTDLQKQLNVKLPTRQSDVVAMCKKVKPTGIIPIVEPFGDVASGSIIARQRMDEYVYSVDPDWNIHKAAGKTSFETSPLWKRALQSIVEWKDAGCFQDGSTGTSRAQQYALFAQGKALTSVLATTELPNILAINPNLHYRYFNLPPDNPKNTIVPAATTYLVAANAQTQHPKEVKTFLNFLFREKQNSLLAKASGSLSGLDVKKLNFPSSMSLLEPLARVGKFTEGHEAGWPNDAMYQSVLATGIIGLITGQTTVDKILADMDAAWANKNA
jgi:raffinose/stachyose/melibiose transport system substrate-binding protein